MYMMGYHLALCNYQGDWRLHFNFRCLQGAQESGIRFRFRTTRKLPSGEWPECEEVVEGGVGVMAEKVECDRYDIFRLASGTYTSVSDIIADKLPADSKDFPSKPRRL